MRIFTLSVVAFIFSYNVIFGNGVEPIGTLLKDKIVTIDLNRYPSDFVQIDIYDRTGFKLFSEMINTDKYSIRNYSLEELPIGRYSITLKTAQRIITNMVDVDNREIKLLKEFIFYKPNLHVDGNTWNMNLLAQNQKTHIEIYNERKETLYRETIKNKMGINKSYNLNNLDEGKYYIAIKVGQNTFVESLVKS